MRSAQQDARAEESADDAGEKEKREQAARVWSERVAVGDGAGDGAGPERRGTGGVGGDGRHASKHQGGERDETAAAGDGVEQSGDERGEKEEERVRKVHARE